MTEDTLIYFVKAGPMPNMRQAILVNDGPEFYTVRNIKRPYPYRMNKRYLASRGTLATTDRANAVTTLLTNLQDAKARNEARLVAINAAIKDVIDKEGL